MNHNIEHSDMCYQHAVKMKELSMELQLLTDKYNIKLSAIESTLSQVQSEFQIIQSILETLGTTMQRIEIVLSGTMGTDGFIKDYAQTKKTVNFLSRAIWFVTVLPAVLAGIAAVLNYFK